MDTLIWVVKIFLLPGSVPFLILAIAIGVLLLYGPERARRRGRRWITALLVSYWVLAVPAGADLVSGMIGYGYGPIQSAADARGAAAVVVLDGGTQRFRARSGAIDTVSRPSGFRTLEAVRVYRLLGDPLVIVTSGADAPQSPSSPEGGSIREELARAGVPRQRILLDTASPNTRAHATTLGPLLRERGIGRVVLVTSLTHIRRAVWTFRAEGIDVVPSAALVHADEPPEGWRWTRWWPSVEALQVSEDSLRDALAIIYYWGRGWLSRS